MSSKHFLYVIACGNFIFDDDDDKNDVCVEKVDLFAEETVPRFNCRQFKEHFRLESETFDDLAKKLFMCTIPHLSTSQCNQMSIEKRIMITLWYLGNLESFRSVSSRFGVSKSTCWDVVNRTCLELLTANKKYNIISWPSPQQALKYIDEFKDINGFPGVLGAIDGCHVRILPPKEFPNSYFNRKKFHSVLLQGVCNRRKLFLDVYVGEPGSIHDANLFAKSDLSQNIHDNIYQFPNNSHLIGDLAYPLSKTCLVGFKDYGNLDGRQINFNQRLSQLRIVIEHTFALLKGRFRRCKFLETKRLDLICLFVISACILHNICILNGDIPEEIMDFNMEFQEQQEQNIDEILENRDNVRLTVNEGGRKRNSIMNVLEFARNNR